MLRMLLLLLLLPLTAAAADEHRISFLEQEVRNLQRQVLSLSRQVDELKRPGRAGGPSSPIIIESGANTGGELPAWVDAARWQKVREGMGELEVIQALGKPSSMRETAGARVLLYALELGPAAFLSGSVTLRDGTVVEVRRPTLQ
jgi:hypothetical protein